jgi:hypothetical protein
MDTRTMRTIEQIRERIITLQDEREELARAWPSEMECREGIAEHVKMLARGGLAQLGAADLRKGRIDARHVDPLCLLAVFDPERLATQLADMALAEFPDPGLSAEDRAKRLAKLESDLLAAEVDEERMIRKSPIPIIRRGDARPEIVLAPDLENSAALAA